MQRQPGTVVIADQHEFYRDGLGSLLGRKTGLRCKTARGVGEAVGLIEQLENAALLVLDSAVEGMRGVETVRMLRQRFPNLRILVTIDRAERREVFDLVGAGAHGVVSKVTESAETLVAVRTVLGGHIFIPPSVTEPPSRASGDTAPSGQSQTLTNRQFEIVTLMSQGHSNKVIARTLGISPSTVKVHLHAAFRALGVHSRVSAASAAFPPGRGVFFGQDVQPHRASEKLAGR